MRAIRTRKSDATFELNLAPFLDIIVSVVPMLLLSVVFVQIKMIETPIPQVVAEKIAEQKKSDKVPVSMSLTASPTKGFVITVHDNGKTHKTEVGLVEKKLNFDGLQAAAVELKRKYTDVFKIDFAPQGDVSYDDIVHTMDSLRRLPKGEKVAFMDTKSGQSVQTDLMFPDVTFSNVLGD